MRDADTPTLDDYKLKCDAIRLFTLPNFIAAVERGFKMRCVLTRSVDLPDEYVVQVIGVVPETGAEEDAGMLCDMSSEMMGELKLPRGRTLAAVRADLLRFIGQALYDRVTVEAAAEDAPPLPF